MIRRVGMLVESLEEELLGRRGMSFELAVKRSGWKPQPISTMCWRCAETIGPFESDGDGCGRCRQVNIGWDRAVRLDVHDGIVRDAVLDLKFRRWHRTGIELGRAMGRRLMEHVESMGVEPREVVVVPVPMTKRRQLKRGINHTSVLTQGIVLESGVGSAPLLQARPRHEQVGLGATDRVKNIRGGFFVSERAVRKLEMEFEKKEFKPRVVCVFDDVRTTGSTLGEGVRVLKRVFRRSGGVFGGCEIWACCIGTPMDGREVVLGDGLNCGSVEKGEEIEQEVCPQSLTLRS